jgi:radical SAM-linked protein
VKNVPVAAQTSFAKEEFAVPGFDFYAVYKKEGRAKYISHLDMVRMFNRVFRRGGIPISYSEGFNPHPKISFILPLPVFYESECEVLLFSLTQKLPCDEIKDKFNAVMPDGLSVLSVSEGKIKSKDLDSALYFAFSEHLPTEEEISRFLDRDTIVIPKKTKSGINDTDIKSDIRSIRLSDGKIEMRLSAGSSANLKPDVVINAMNKYIDNFNAGSCEYLRTKILDENENSLI